MGPRKTRNGFGVKRKEERENPNCIRGQKHQDSFASDVVVVAGRSPHRRAMPT